jgi:hypothetical protein
MGKVYDSIILLLLILVFVGFVWLQKKDIPSVSPVNHLEKQAQKEAFQNQGSPGSPVPVPIPLPTRTLEINAAKKSICNLQNVFDTLQCSTYLVTNPTRPTTSTVSTLVVPPPRVAVTGNIDNLKNFAIANGDISNVVKENDMIYFGHTIDMQGPFLVKSVSLASPIPSSEATVFAGNSSVMYAADGTGINASFNMLLGGIAIDSAGNLYVGDETRIRKISSTGVVSTLLDLWSSTNNFTNIIALTLDYYGRLYVSYDNKRTLTRIDPDGTIFTGENQYVNDGSSIDTIRLNSLSAISSALGDPIVTFYSTATIHNRIIKQDYDRAINVYLISVFAGTGVAGSEDGSKLSATFRSPQATAVHPITGYLYIADTGNHKIRLISEDQVTTYAGTGTEGSEDGSKLSATFSSPRALAFDSAGNLYVADSDKLRRITVSGNVDTIASVGCSALAFDAIGNLFLTSSTLIYKIPASTILRFTAKYLGPNLRNSVMAMVSSSASTSVSSGTMPVLELLGADELKKEVYIFDTKLNYTLSTAETACATFNGEVATLEQMRKENRQGADTCLFSLVKNSTGAAISAVSVQAPNACASLPVGVNTQVSSTNNSALACYGVKPPTGTSIGNSTIKPFSSSPLLYNNPHVITGYVDAGTNYITTTNDVLPENLKIGDTVYIQGRCNRYDTDNGDGTCTGYSCNTGETDLLSENKCQRYGCRAKVGSEGDHTNNNNGTCTVPKEHSTCPSVSDAFGTNQKSYMSRVETTVNANDTTTCTYKYLYMDRSETQAYVGLAGAGGAWYDNTVDAGYRGRGYNEYGANDWTYLTTISNITRTYPLKKKAYSYDIIKAGVKSTQYEKTTANPSYRYPKVLGPYIVAANPAVGKILLKSKHPGDFDENGKFRSVSSTVAEISNKVPASFGLQNVVITKVSPIDNIIMNLVKKGTIKNYDQCIRHATVSDLATKNTMAGDDSNLNTTRYTMCASYYKEAWTHTNAMGDTDDRKDEYKTGRGISLTKKVVACPAGSFADELSCIKCPAGKTSVAGGECVACPGGQSSEEGGQCTNCPDGQTSVPGELCSACPVAGQVCVCPYGQSSAVGGVCTACPSGYTCPGKQTNPYKYTCPGGTLVGAQCNGIMPAGTPTCPPNVSLETPRGLWSQESIIAGGHQSLGNRDSLGRTCIYEVFYFDTALGFYRSTNVFRSKLPIPAAGIYIAPKEYLYCPNRQSSTSGGSCNFCPAGQSSEGGGACTNCPAGQTSVAGGTCRNCDANFSSQPGGQCTICPTGQISAAGGICGCAPGYSSVEGRPCSACPAGYSSTQGGPCVECPVGYYCPGATAAVPCPAGKTSAGTSAESGIKATSCTDCPAGQSSREGGTCTKCRAGQSSVAGGACTDCFVGEYSEEGGLCRRCPAGKTSRRGTAICFNCPAGQQPSSSPYSFIFEPCENCAPGYGTDGGGGLCSACPYPQRSVGGGPCQ